MDTHFPEDETAADQRVRELFARLVSYSYLKSKGLLVERPRRGDPDPNGGDDGPPFGAALALPVPEVVEYAFRSYPARRRSAGRARP